MTNSFKPYACCRHTHSANYAIQQLIKEKGLKAENVETILDRTYSTAVDLLITLHLRHFMVINLVYSIALLLLWSMVMCLIMYLQKKLRLILLFRKP